MSSSASAGLIAHELKHAYQFETGSFSIGKTVGDADYTNLLYDKHDEVEAYKRQAFFGGNAYGLNNLPSGYDAYPNTSYNYKNIPEIQGAMNSSSSCEFLQNLSNRVYHAFRINGTTYYPK